ncbi:CPBP family intramembrane glutamic endopeptidase [Paenibacillus soyae]|uniref:CPBP family intramembrane metalloprotease n=1 Tax=Paenibacillus soyae TaxID=2969249 RepID=A0A9X2MWY4_9BACL|nr:CPBP family intramembrane glutamic endopeptidase [Paenibacillus soyae]MCR2807899.1 CPBP family intramembrane metalloprotease [Paenibacillus soyae]
MKPLPLEPQLVRRPYLMLVWIELALLVFVAGGSAYVSIAELTHPAAPFFGFIPLALILLLALTIKKGWRTFYFDGISRIRGKQWLDYAPLLLILIVLLVANRGFADAPATTFVYLFLSQILLVAFVEETLFRGILIRLFAHKGARYAVLISSFFFGVTHALQALGGQSLEDTILQIVYAFAVGLVLALLVIKHRSIVLTIVFHGLHNFIIMTGHDPGTHLYDYLILALLAVHFIWLALTFKNRHPFTKDAIVPHVT